MANLSIRGLKHAVRLGCNDAERSFPQVVTTDLCIHTDMDRCIETDALADAVDYEAVARAVDALGRGGEWKLIEKLAHDIGRRTLDVAPQASHVDVTVTKIILPQAAGVAASLTVRR